MRSTDSRWDDTCESAAVDPDVLIEALPEDLIADGDVVSALQRVVRWGLQRDDGARTPGVQQLLQQIRSQRQEELARYNLDAVLQDVQEQLNDVVATERAGIDRRLQGAGAGEPMGDLNEMLARRPWRTSSATSRVTPLASTLSPGTGPAATAPMTVSDSSSAMHSCSI